MKACLRRLFRRVNRERIKVSAQQAGVILLAGGVAHGFIGKGSDILGAIGLALFGISLIFSSALEDIT